ncbi:tyrosine-type recombinase/integrase [Haloarchaeobius litoreus]|uniref:Tyrosine-type recombinase/integrase n=1 Tax=Haloarchaeobius litoreus TaxID=755306 RepID=A0ABD6DKW8_9EURY|nr:site-specific integrase [Haloarchaeobius litoreus]
MPRGFKDIEECRPEIKAYAKTLESGTDDNDEDQRATASTKRYKQDVRWFDHWLDEHNIDSAYDVTSEQALEIGEELTDQYNGTTPRYRWDRIYAMYDHFVALEKIDRNPLERWNGDKKSLWGMSKSTEQSKQLGDDEDYAVDAEDVRAMEENVGRNRVRDQLLIRLLWHTGMRRGEAEAVTLEMMDEDEREIHLPSSVTKNGKDRIVAWQPNLDGLLRQWIGGLRDDYLGGRDHDHLFVGERGAPLSAEAINEIVIRAADNAGINRQTYADANAVEPEDGSEPEPNRWLISSHNIRHGLGSHLVHETPMSLYEVSRYLGHQSVEVTEQTYIEYDPRAGVDEAHEFVPK